MTVAGDPPREEVVAFLRREARHAFESDADDTSKMLRTAAWLLMSPPEEQDVEFRRAAFRHYTRMNLLRHVVAITLVLTLFAVIGFGAWEGYRGEEIAQIAAPLSGLAGIAIGWLFGGHQSERFGPGEGGT